MDKIQVIPKKDGTWRVSTAGDEVYETRRDAIDAAYHEAGIVPLTDPEGIVRSYTDPDRSVELLKLDGSVHGELRAAPSGGEVQQVSVTPAGEESKA